ncbi:MAG: tRNA uridine-5-carboxymethylaminomethyl(34) synthesis GTPase MnmE [Alphaproteobacteria bacterium]|nr:tRNA uridine-5-carboxymethylaminomethyl(34) synthesis GTPase MnmE [Alphaproteobacteria bacterium]
MKTADTIYALATPPGKSGVAIIRISGSAAPTCLSSLGCEVPKPRMATRLTLKDGNTILDDALGIYFKAPHSFTGEDVIELHTHGSRAIIKAVLEALSKNKALRVADAGEFSKRAFLNGKLDLAQAEGLADLIDAETTAQHTQAMRQFAGQNSALFEELRQSVLHPLALLEAYIDFPDEEIPEAVLADVNTRIEALRANLRAMLDDNHIGEKIRQGIEVVILGAPNAGKSSLLNTLARRDVAIVSEVAGTTRDMIEVHLDINGYPVTLIDTAGLRETSDSIEKEGVLRAKNRAKSAELKLLLIDSITRSESHNDFVHDDDTNTLIIYTKNDVGKAPENALSISTKTGEGIQELIEAVKSRVLHEMGSSPSPLITRARHREALQRALDALGRFSSDTPLELQCEELRIAAHALGKITGKIDVEDVLDVVFSTFCIGK